jgi:hypothetical protein
MAMRIRVSILKNEFHSSQFEGGKAEGQPESQNTQTMINKSTFHKANFCNAKFRLVGGLFAKFRCKKNLFDRRFNLLTLIKQTWRIL